MNALHIICGKIRIILAIVYFLIFMACGTTSPRKDSSGIAWPPKFTASEIGLPDHPKLGTEIRVWLGGGVVHPYDLYRIYENEQGITGEHIAWTKVQKTDAWKPPRSQDEVDKDNAGMIAFMKDQVCKGQVEKTSEIIFCRIIIESTVIWKVVAQDLMPSQIWKLPEKIKRDCGSTTFDGEIVTIEILNSTERHIVEYDNPDFCCSEIPCAIANHIREVVRRNIQ
jgi:hypothetical protein